RDSSNKAAGATAVQARPARGSSLRIGTIKAPSPATPRARNVVRPRNVPAAAPGRPFALAAMPAPRFSSSSPDSSTVTTNADTPSRAATASTPSKNASAPATTSTRPPASSAIAAREDTVSGGYALAAFAEQRGRRHHTGPDSGTEVRLDPLPDRVGAAISLEAIEVEAELPGALPQVRIVEPALVGEQRVVHLPEAVLERRGLGGAREHLAARVLRHDREVAEDLPHRALAQLRLDLRAVRALVVAVDDHERALAPHVVAVTHGWDAGAAELGQAALCAANASKIRFAP